MARESGAIRRCAAGQCLAEVEPRYLFCRHHFKMLPKPLQQNIWDRCRPGTGLDARPSAGWIEAAAEAVEYLAEAERRDRQNRFREALLRRVAIATGAGQGG
jgi:hypothetical protein